MAPDNGAGTFSPVHTWVDDANDGIDIEADRMDEQDEDIADALTNRIPRDGQGAPTADIPWGGFKIENLGDAAADTDALNRQSGDARFFVQTVGAWAAEATVTAAATTNILGASAIRCLIDGAETITSLGTGTNRLRVVRFNGINTLTHHATSLILPTGANITTASGDMMIVVSDASSNARVVVYQRASGASLVAGDAATTAAAGIVELATAAEYRDDTSGAKALTPEFVWDAAEEVTLTDAATIAVDLDTGINFVVTLGGNRALGNPTNEKPGQSGVIRVVQDGTGSRTLSYGTDYEFAGGTAPTLSTTAADQDLLFYYVIASNRVFISSALDIS